MMPIETTQATATTPWQTISGSSSRPPFSGIQPSSRRKIGSGPKKMAKAARPRDACFLSKRSESGRATRKERITPGTSPYTSTAIWAELNSQKKVFT